MQFTRRNALLTLGGLSLKAATGPDVMPGPFTAAPESLKAYRIPEWFRDAKFGIWAHWGPASVPEYGGDWYARNMYVQGHKQYKYHCERYGHPSKFGLKDIIGTWKAEKFDADHLLQLYKKAGAKYFFSMGVHHDNFDLWNSRLNPWNSVRMGPKKDIVGLFAKAAKKHGLRFGVSDHLAVSYHWLQTSHGSDKAGPLAGVPYDGADPKYAGLYHETHAAPKNAWDESGVPAKWKQHYFDRIKDVIDQYEPDLLYTDGPIFFGEYGRAVAAHFYNRAAKKYGGSIEGVYANKSKTDCVNGTCLLDLERGVVDKIWDEPWQTDTCIGKWFYDREVKYKTPKTIIDMLVDIVSRNGNLLLSFPLPASGALDAAELKILEELTSWMAVNSEAIHGTRPWKIYGSVTNLGVGRTAGDHHVAEAFNENKRQDYTAQDIRYTRKGNTLYAFSMGWPEGPIAFTDPGFKVTNVTLLGHQGKLNWKQDEQSLTVTPPSQRPCEHAVVFKVVP